MSETAPRSNPRLDNFEANKATHEREQFENELYGEAGQSDFSDTAKKRVEEADEYERHMERLAGETRSDYDRGLDRLESGETESAAYNKEWDDAIAENDEHDAYKRNEEFDAAEAIRMRDEKIQGNVVARRANQVTEEIIALRGKTPEGLSDAEKDRLAALEERLQDLLERYSNEDGYDAEISDYLLDRGTNVSTLETPETAPADEKKARTPEEFSETDSPEQMIADIADLISKETDPVKKAEAQEKLREIMTQIEKALEDKDKKGDDLSDLDDASAPKVGEGEKSDLDDLDDKDAPKVGEEESDLEDLDGKKAPEVTDAADKKDTDGEEHDLEDLDELSAPEVGEAPAETEDTRRWYKRAWDRAGILFIVGLNKAGERMHLPEKRSTRVATAIGAVTLLAVGGALAWKYGFHHGGSGGNNNSTDPNTLPTPKPKQPTVEVPPVTPKGPEIPNADNYAHPWNWMKAAIDNGSVKPPQGMGPEQALHHYGQMAAEAGHKVEWYNLPNGLEAVRIDGSDDTKVVGDILSQFAK